MPIKSYRTYRHLLITEDKNDFGEVRQWLKMNMDGDWEMERLEVPHALENYASIYIKEKTDFFLFKMRWYPEE